MVVLENVPRLLTLDNGAVHRHVSRSLATLGYLVHYRILNSAEYGAPQSRKRLFYVAVRPGHAHAPASRAHPGRTRAPATIDSGRAVILSEASEHEIRSGIEPAAEFHPQALSQPACIEISSRRARFATARTKGASQFRAREAWRLATASFSKRARGKPRNPFWPSGNAAHTTYMPSSPNQRRRSAPWCLPG